MMARDDNLRPYALRLYVNGEGSSSLLCREPCHECPQWWYKPENRYKFTTPQEALAFLGTIQGEWPEFKEHDARVVRVIPPQEETYAEVRFQEPVTLEDGA